MENVAILLAVHRSVELFRYLKPEGGNLSGISERQFVKSMCRVHYEIADEKKVERYYDTLLESKELANKNQSVLFPGGDRGYSERGVGLRSGSDQAMGTIGSSDPLQ
jgi:hypothetical protein